MIPAGTASPKRVGGMVEVADQGAALRRVAMPRVGVDADAVHRRQVDHEPVLDAAESRRRCGRRRGRRASRPSRARELDRGANVGDVAAAHDQRGPLVDHRVVEHPRAPRSRGSRDRRPLPAGRCGAARLPGASSSSSASSLFVSESEQVFGRDEPCHAAPRARFAGRSSARSPRSSARAAISGPNSVEWYSTFSSAEANAASSATPRSNSSSTRLPEKRERTWRSEPQSQGGAANAGPRGQVARDRAEARRDDALLAPSYRAPSDRRAAARARAPRRRPGGAVRT